MEQYSEHMRTLWNLAGEIGTKAERDNDERYARIYAKLSEALDIAEETKLIQYPEETYENPD